ncbi:MAG: spore cortex-lytic enzyme [Oscillospiraceae bacterium]
MERVRLQKKHRRILRVVLVLLLNLAILFSVARIYTVQNETVATLSKYGSRGSEVTNIQTKLKSLGLYTDKIDGIYGKNTQAAVRTFQRQRGLQVDGIAGPQTLKALGLTSGGATGGFSQRDIDLLARIISAESRGEPYIGQVAVGAVILNRVEHPSFPDTIAGVVYQPGAFTAVVDGQINQPVAESSVRAAQEVLNGSDPSGGAIYYYNPDKTSNKWMLSRPVIKRIGKHLFCS